VNTFLHNTATNPLYAIIFWLAVLLIGVGLMFYRERRRLILAQKRLEATLFPSLTAGPTNYKTRVYDPTEDDLDVDVDEDEDDDVQDQEEALAQDTGADDEEPAFAVVPTNQPSQITRNRDGSVTALTGPHRRRRKKTIQIKSSANGKDFKPTPDLPTPLISIPGRASFRRLTDPERYACAKLLVWGFTTEQLRNYFGVSKVAVLESARGNWKNATEYLGSTETTSLYIKAFRLGKKSKHHDYLATNTDKTTTLAIQLLLDLNILHREYFAEAFDVSTRKISHVVNRYFRETKLRPHQQKILDNLKNGPAVLLVDVDMGNGS
jgi:hypothetical protein